MKQDHTCPKCEVTQPVALFQQSAGWCRSCRTECERQRRLAKGITPKRLSRIKGGEKLCMECETMKPMTEFSPAVRGLGGVAAYCRPCMNVRFKSAPEVASEATAAYRRRHRERHLAAHRVHQHNRKQSVRATDDGTVTDAFLKALYGTEHCTYCSNFTERQFRTADHRIPLARGGSHSASNLVMACNSCNSRKRDRTDIEFREQVIDHIS